MKNLGQIKVVNKVLENDRKNFLLELGQVNQMIQKKMANIQKIRSYRSEYTNKDHLQLTKSIPALNQNLEHFTQKISDLINKEELEIVKLQRSRQSLLKTIEQLDNKISMMKTFEDRAKSEIRMKKERIEQANLDDLASNKKTRGEENG